MKYQFAKQAGSGIRFLIAGLIHVGTYAEKSILHPALCNSLGPLTVGTDWNLSQEDRGPQRKYVFQKATCWVVLAQFGELSTAFGTT